MTVYYVDFSGSAGSGNGSSFANRASLIKNISHGTLTAGTDEIRCKGNPVTSLGTAKIINLGRDYPSYGSEYLSGSDLNYVNSTGETYWTDDGWQTGDRIFILEDTVAAATSQPSLAGIHTITIDSNYNNRVKIDGYTASSTTSGSGGNLRYCAINSDIFELNTSNLTREIASMEFGRTAWTGVSGVTTSIDVHYGNNSFSDYVSSLFSGSDKISVPTSQSVGKIAHYQLPSTLDLSGYQQLSFMCRVGTSSNGDISFSTPDTIRLCTDTGGNTSVHTASINIRNAGGTWWIASVTDFGANMNSSIKSIALYREASQSSEVTYRFQNFIACKDSSSADSITHQSLVGLNDTIPIWYNVAFIKGDLVCVKGMDNYRGNKAGFYNGGWGVKWTKSGNSVDMYKVEPFLPTGATSDSQIMDEIDSTTGSYTDNNFVTVSGGWNATDMSSKSGVTIIQGNGRGTGIEAYNETKFELKDLFWHSFWQVRLYYSYHIKITDCGIAHLHNTSSMSMRTLWGTRGLKFNYLNGFRSYLYFDYFSQASAAVASDFNFNYCGFGAYGYVYFDMEANAGTHNYADHKNFLINNFDASPTQAYDVARFYDFDLVQINEFKTQGGGRNATPSFYDTKKATFASVNVTSNFDIGSDTEIRIDSFTHTLALDANNPTTSVGKLVGGYQYGIALDYSGNKDFYIGGGSLMGEVETEGSAIKLNGLTKTGYGSVRKSSSSSPVFWRNFNGTSGDQRSYYSAHLITHDSSTVHTAGGKSLKAQVLSTSASADTVPLGSIMVNGGTAVTISIYVYITGSNEQVTLSAKLAPWLGLSADQTVTADTSSGTSQNTWTQITKTFTPTAAGKIDIVLDLSNNSTSSVMFVDDFGVSQA